MPIAEFTSPLSITQCKSGDVLIFEIDETTPYDFELTVYSLAGAVLYGPVAASTTRDGVHYWYVTADASCGFSSTQTYYDVVITDNTTNEIDDKRHIVYVTGELDFENYIVRALCLAGNNCRAFNHVWQRGMLQSFSVRIYASKALMDTAIAGGTDTYIADYTIEISYDEKYNRTEVRSVKS